MADAEKPEQSLEAGRESAAERPEENPTLEGVAAEEVKAERAIEREERQEEGTIGAGIKSAGDLGGPEGQHRAEEIAGAQVQETKDAAEVAEGRVVEAATDGGSGAEGAKEESASKGETDQAGGQGSESEQKAEEPQLTREEWRAREIEFRGLPDQIGNLRRKSDERKRVLEGAPGTWFTNQIDNCVVNGQQLGTVQRDRNGVWRDGNEKQISGDTAAELEAMSRRKIKEDITRLEQEKDQASERLGSISKQRDEEWQRQKLKMEEAEAKRKPEEPEAPATGENSARPRGEGDPEGREFPRPTSYRDGSRGEIPHPPMPPEYLGGSFQRRWESILQEPGNQRSRGMMREIFARAFANGENEGSMVEDMEVLRNEMLARGRERRDSADKLIAVLLQGVMARFAADSERSASLLGALNRIGSALRKIGSLLEERLNPPGKEKVGAHS